MQQAKIITKSIHLIFECATMNEILVKILSRQNKKSILILSILKRSR